MQPHLYIVGEINKQAIYKIRSFQYVELVTISQFENWLRKTKDQVNN